MARIKFDRMDEKQQVQWVQEQMSGRYSEGYAKGVHDHDGAHILKTLLSMHRSIDLMRHRPGVRAAAWYWWESLLDTDVRERFASWIGGFQKLARAFPNAQPAMEFRAS